MIDTVKMCQEGKEAGGLRCGELCVQGAAEIERLRAALKPFAIDVGAVSLSKALGHIGREDLLRAKAALEQTE